MSTNGWMIVVAALGSSALTAIFGLTLFWLQGRRETKAAFWQARRSAYARLLARTGTLAHTADALHIVADAESGIAARAAVALHARKPVEPMAIAEYLRHDVDLLYEAWAEVSICGTPEAVRLGNVAVDAGVDLVSAASQGAVEAGGQQDEGVRTQRTNRWPDKTGALAAARRSFADLARREMGVASARLFLEDEFTE